MSSPVKPFIFLLILLLPLSLGSCGFSPVYGKKTVDANAPALAGVHIDPIANRTGQELKTQLEDLLNPGGAVPANPVYRLSVTVTSTSAAVDTSRTGTVSRYNVYLDAHYTLYRISDGKQITTGNVRQVTSYNNLITDYFSTYVAGNSATDRGVTELSEDIRLRLAPYLTQEKTPVPDKK